MFTCGRKCFVWINVLIARKVFNDIELITVFLSQMHKENIANATMLKSSITTQLVFLWQSRQFCNRSTILPWVPSLLMKPLPATLVFVRLHRLSVVLSTCSCPWLHIRGNTANDIQTLKRTTLATQPH